MGLFAFAATPNFPPTRPGALPWYLAVAGIGLFGLLNTLKVVRRTRTEFEADVAAAKAPADAAIVTGLVDKPDADWRTWVGRVFSVVFLGVWLEALAFFFMFGRGMRDGSPVPTPTHSWPLTDHGRTVYLTMQDGQLIEILQRIMMVGIPGAMLLGVLLHFGLGVQLFSNLPTWRRSNRDG
eukprot:gene26850-27075_t